MGKTMKHSNIYLTKDYYKVYNNIIDLDIIFNIANILNDSDDWNIAKVTDNGNSYIVMPTVRRQKIISRDDTEDINILNIFDIIEKSAFEKAKESGLNIEELEVEICHIIRSDRGDFFSWHPDGNPSLPRVFSLLLAFNDNFIGGEIEFYNGEGNDPIIHHLKEGSGIGYNSLASSRHHKVLRGVSFMGFCILRRNKDSFKAYLESIKEENNIKN